MTTDNVGQGSPSPQPPLQAVQPPAQPGSGGSQGGADGYPQAAAFAPWGNIPAALTKRRQWCLAGADKRPITATGLAASVTDPATWTDFETVCRAATTSGRGIGYVLTADDPFTCIDLDVKETTPPAHLQRFERIVSSFDTYTERSRSGVGLHVWLEGAIGKGRRRDGVEVYSQERFIICTGDVVRQSPIAPRPDLLGQLVTEMGRELPITELGLCGDDTADFALASRASLDDGELGRLFAGDWQDRYPSQSEADLALVKLLMPHTDSARECWMTFRLSVLGKRTKAERPDYAQSTLGVAAQQLARDAAALEHGREMSASLFWRPPPRSSRYFRLMRDGELANLPPLRWLVKRVIPDAGIGAIYGESGSFKSFLTLDLLAHISNGKEWFGHRVRAAPAVYVPFEGQGGIPNRVKAWRLAEAARRDPSILLSVVPPDDVATNVAVIMDPLNLREPADRDKLVATLIDNGWAGGVVCIDTLAHASSGLDENSSAMAEMITIFRDLQHRLGGVILLIHHSGKDQSRGMRGWSGLHAAMDFVVECQRPKARSTEAQFVLTKVKDGAAAKAFGFMMQAIPIGFDEDGEGISSLVVSPSSAHGDDSQPRETDAERDTADDEFVWEWVARALERDEYPSGRSLEGQREQQMCPVRAITQKRLRDAIHRLRATSRLIDADGKAPSGNRYMVTA